MFNIIFRRLDVQVDRGSKTYQMSFRHGFHNAVSAYENGDLDGLRLIGEMVSAPVLPDRDEDGLVALEKERERLMELLEAVREEIEGIKDEYPYILKSIVESPERTAAKRAELEKDAARLRKTEEKPDRFPQLRLEKSLSEMTIGGHDSALCL